MKPASSITMCSLTMFCLFVMSPIVFSRDQSQKDAVEAQFNEMDANGDGKLALDEHAAGARKMFDIMDVNKDGKVTVMENGCYA